MTKAEMDEIADFLDEQMGSAVRQIEQHAVDCGLAVLMPLHDVKAIMKQYFVDPRLAAGFQDAVDEAEDILVTRLGDHHG